MWTVRLEFGIVGSDSIVMPSFYPISQPTPDVSVAITNRDKID